MSTRLGMMWPAVVLGLVLAVVVTVASRDVVHADYNPTLEASVSDATAGANADVVTDFNVPVGDFNYSVVVTFTPAEFFVAADADITDGTHVANLDALATLGLLNAPCTNALNVSFELKDAVTDTSNTVAFADSYADSDGNGLLDGVDKYPDFLNELFPGLTPRSRSFGHTQAAGTNVTMNLVIFEPGTALLGLPAFDSSLGYPSVSVLNNPKAALAPNPITDFCSPLTATTTNFGEADGQVYRTNPTSGGDYTFTIFTTSNPDADGDGYENAMDTCPYDVNEGSPFEGTGDNDNDGLDNVCDPTPDEALTDYDGDGYMNRGDNCPLIANGPSDADNQGDADRDGIGDACDTSPDTMDGTPIEKTLTSVVTIEGGEEPTAEPTEAPTEEPTETATVEPTETPEATATPAATATPEATATATATPVPPEVGGAGLLGSGDDGLPIWALSVIGIAAVLLVGSIGTMATVARRRQ